MAPNAVLRLLAAILGLAIAASAQPASAQGRSGEPGQFDFYVLALSWSPGFCETAGDRRRSSQCDAGRKLGFVVHGLWPQYEHGFPSDCGSDRFIPRNAMSEAEGVYPDQGLARYEWRKHGTCSGLGPGEYFSAVRTARERVKVPDALTELGQEGRTSPQNIERAFSEANPGLRSDMMAVDCRRSALQEVRICMTKDLRGFRPCPEVNQRACKFGPIRVSAPR